MINFEELVNQAIKELPDNIRTKADNIALCLEDDISSRERSQAGVRIGKHILGLYQGFPRTTWGRSHIAGRLPDKITIFKDPILRLARNEEETKELVKIVVWHEIAHHFGFNEKEVRLLENKWHLKLKKNNLKRD
jgi:predicted Zn-dependent protease with MMP-like domain